MAIEFESFQFNTCSVLKPRAYIAGPLRLNAGEIAKLPTDEQKDCVALWREVERLFDRVGGSRQEAMRKSSEHSM